jgi:hypothetical protein
MTGPEMETTSDGSIEDGRMDGQFDDGFLDGPLHPQKR